MFTVSVLDGNDADAASAAAMATPDDSHDRRSALSATIDEQDGAFAQPGGLNGDYEHIAGPLRRHQLVRTREHELIVHSWDRTQADDPPAEIPTVLVRWAVEDSDRLI